MSDAVTDILKTLVPGIATALGGPLASVAVGWLTDKLGVKESTVSAVTDAIQGVDPLARAKLEQEFNQWFIEEQQKELQMYLADTQSARERDKAIQVATGHNTRADSMYVLAIVVVVSLVWLIWSKTELDDYVKGIMTLVLGRFLGYLDSMYNFEFGNTRSNKTKDETISNLSKGS